MSRRLRFFLWLSRTASKRAAREVYRELGPVFYWNTWEGDFYVGDEARDRMMLLSMTSRRR